MSQEQQTLLQQKITFHGAGAMAEAIVRGLISRLVVRPQDITMLNRSNLKRQEELSSRYAVHTGTASQSLEQLASSPVIVLCMKPKDAAAALRDLGPLLSPDQLIVSVIAGLSIRTMQTLLGRKQPIARTMPNTSSTIGLGATGIAFSSEITDEQRSIVMTLFEAVGIVTIVPEDKLEVLTGISGSGPAYVYYLMEAMIAAGIRGGLSSQQSSDLTVQTVLGAARMVQQTGFEPMKLRSDVTSPGGATQAALKTLDEGDFFENVIAAVNRCAERSREMGAALEGDLKNE